MPPARSINTAFILSAVISALFVPAHALIQIPPMIEHVYEDAQSEPGPPLGDGAPTDGMSRSRTDHHIGHEPNPMLDLLEDPSRFVIVGHIAFVANLEHGLMALDIHDPAKPTLIGQHNTPGNSLGVDAVGSTVFVADGFGGLLAIDVRDPRNMVLLGQHDSTGYAYGVSVIDQYAFLTQFGANVQEIDLHELELPCQPDMVEDGVLDQADIAFFGEAYQNEHPLADLNNDGMFTFLDFSLFLELFAAGCP